MGFERGAGRPASQGPLLIRAQLREAFPVPGQGIAGALLLWYSLAPPAPWPGP